MLIVVKLVVALAIIGSFFAIWRVESGWRIVVTPFLFLSYFELVRVLPPFFVADAYEVTTSLAPLAAAAMAFTAIIFGFMLSYGYHPVIARNTLSLTVANTPQLPVARGEKMGVVGVVALLLASGLVLYGGLPPVGHALVGFLSGAGADMADYVTAQRYELTKAAYFGGQYRGQGAIRTLQLIGWMMVCSYSVLHYAERRTLRRLAWFLAALATAWVFVAGDGTRGPFMNLLIVVVATYSLRRPLKLRTVAILFAVVVALGIALSLYSNKMYNVLQESNGNFAVEAVTRILDRIFIANGMNDVRAIDMVNHDEIPLRWGAIHFRDFVSAIPGVEYGTPFAYELFAMLNPRSRGTTFFSATYLTDVYVDFGWIGLFPVFFLTGWLIGKAQRTLFARTRTRWRLAVMAVVAFTVVTVLRSGYSGLVAQFVVIGILVLTQLVAASVARGFSGAQAPPPHNPYSASRDPLRPRPAPAALGPSPGVE